MFGLRGVLKTSSHLFLKILDYPGFLLTCSQKKKKLKNNIFVLWCDLMMTLSTILLGTWNTHANSSQQSLCCLNKQEGSTIIAPFVAKLEFCITQFETRLCQKSWWSQRGCFRTGNGERGQKNIAWPSGKYWVLLHRLRADSRQAAAWSGSHTPVATAVTKCSSQPPHKPC